jgi:hypothetical protein
MKHNIIKTENYLLVVDDSEIKNWYLDDVGVVRKATTWDKEYWSVRKDYKKITAHLPLNNSPILEGVPLLPPLENEVEEVWEQGLGAELEKILPYMKHLDDGQYNSGQLVGFEIGATWGYNKTKEKYNADLGELLSDFYLFATNGEVCDHEVINEFIQSLQQSKMPVAFECEWTTKQMPEFHQDEPKTTTNPQGQTVWVGKYIY